MKLRWCSRTVSDCPQALDLEGLGNVTLLHELLHSYTGLGDIDLAEKFGYTTTDWRKASAAIQSELEHACAPKEAR